jgi:hypothetical protein
MGVPTNVASTTMIKDPAMALARPPPSVCGGGVIWVKTAADRPPTPRRMVSNRIHASQKRPKAMAPSDKVKAMALTTLRRP